MRRTSHCFGIGLALTAALGLAGCGDDDGNGDRNDDHGGAGDDKDASIDVDSGGGSSQTLCAKYGGPESVGKVMKEQVVGTIVADCRINSFFAQLSEAQVVRLSDCLAIQAQELFGCPGITYAGSSASNGMPCRSMAAAHAGMGVGQGDFDALIEDVVAGLTEAGVEADDIGAAAPALLGLKDVIVEDEASTDPTMDMCEADGGT